MTTTMLVQRPSLRLRAVRRYLAATRTKWVLGSADTTEADRLRNRAAGVPTPSRRHRRRHGFTRVEIAGVPCLEVVDARGPDPTSTIVHAHGGAYVNPPVVQHWDLVAALATENRARVLVPLYPLAPEGTAATVVPLMVELHAEVRAAYGPDVVWSGDSAGGGLALLVALALRDADRPLPAALVLLAPWVDVGLVHPRLDRGPDPALDVPGLRYAGRLWAGDLDVADPRVSPGFADLAGLPPTTVVVGGHDLFVEDCRDLAARADAAGVDVHLAVAPGGFHVFPAVTFLPESRAARRLVADRLALVATGGRRG